MSLRTLLWTQVKLGLIVFVSMGVGFGSAVIFNNNSESPANDPSTPMDPGVLTFVFLFQAMPVLGQMVAVVSSLYRIDVMLARKREADGRSPGGQSAEASFDPRVCPQIETLTEASGMFVREPTIAHYIRRQGQHLVRPFYASVGVLCIEVALLVIPDLVSSILLAAKVSRSPSKRRPAHSATTRPATIMGPG